MNRLLLFILLFSSFLVGCLTPIKIDSSSFSQSESEIDTEYFDFESFLDEEEVEVDSAYDYILSTKDSSVFVERLFFTGTDILIERNEYKTNDFKILDGESIQYYTDGKLKRKGFYNNGVKDGEWKGFFDKRHIKSIKKYNNGVNIGVWEYFYKNGVLKNKFSYVDGKIEGTSKKYDTTGVIIGEFLYEAHRIIDTLYIDSIQLIKPENKVYKMPELAPYWNSCKGIKDIDKREKCSAESLLDYIYTNLEYPIEAKKYRVEGTTVNGFTINTDGSISDIVCFKPISKHLREASLKVLHAMPNNWVPGKENGIEIRTRYLLPIKFSLGSSNKYGTRKSRIKKKR